MTSFARWRARFAALPRLQRGWWIGGAALLVAVVVLSGVQDSCLYGLAVTLLSIWAPITFLFAMIWLWRRITYRLSFRLILTYFLIGVLPFPLLLTLFAFCGYVVLGQYTATRLGETVDWIDGALVDLAEEAADAAARGDLAEAERLLERGPSLPGEFEAVKAHLRWVVVHDDDVADPERDDAALRAARWTSGETAHGPFVLDDQLVLAALARRGESRVALVLPLEGETEAAFNEDRWFTAKFHSGTVKSDADGISVNSGAERSGDADPPAPAPDGAAPTSGETEAAPPEIITSEDFAAKAHQVRDLWSRRFLFSVHIGDPLRRFESGEPFGGELLLTVVQTSPREALADLFHARYELGRNVWRALVGLTAFFVLIYAVALLLAGSQILAIHRAAARLTRGTKAVQDGDLSHRIPVTRRDQLGDLALAFNEMTASVDVMLEEVAEKERLEQELELAREIQQSLLPARHLRHGNVTLHASFQPAAEVGGDYYDLFPLEDGRLILAIGDVAGHGLSTGLLMAMVKSAVATLVREGRRGADLLERLNGLMLEQPREHRMVTFTLAEIDPIAGYAEITNAGHPPLHIVGGEVREILLPALPIGFQWKTRPPSARITLEPGARLVFYSDGLVEAVNANDAPFGYDRLREVLQSATDTSPGKTTAAELLKTILRELEAHTGGRRLEDDLTVLVVDCGAAGDDG